MRRALNQNEGRAITRQSGELAVHPDPRQGPGAGNRDLPHELPAFEPRNVDEGGGAIRSRRVDLLVVRREDAVRDVERHAAVLGVDDVVAGVV